MIYKASSVAQEVPDLHLEATVSIDAAPQPDFGDDDWEPKWRAFLLAQAEEIYDLLKGSLPDGTLDHLFAVMARDRASALKVLS